MPIKVNVVDNNSTVKVGTTDNNSTVRMGAGSEVTLRRLEMLIKHLEDTKQNLGFIVIDEYIFPEQQHGVVPPFVLNLLTSYLVNKISYRGVIYSLSKINNDKTYEYAVDNVNPNTIKVNVETGYFELYHNPFERDHALLSNLDYEHSGHTGFAGILVKTTSEWNAMPRYVAAKDIIYVYSDYSHDDEGNDIPGIKIGSGNAYLIDLAFIGDDVRDALFEHINNTVIHISEAERLSWNHKITCDDSLPGSSDMLVFTRN